MNFAQISATSASNSSSQPNSCAVDDSMALDDPAHVAEPVLANIDTAFDRFGGSAPLP